MNSIALAGISRKLKKATRDPRSIVRILGVKGYLNWMPDRAYLKLMYSAMTGKKLDLNNPKTFNEKLQWLKLNDRKPEYTELADKYKVRINIGNTIGEEYLIPLLGVWDRFEDIDFEKLPERFVLKCTHDSGGVMICKDKSNFDVESARERINKLLNRNYYHICREWPYKNIEPKIICEKYMEDDPKEDLKDYKFMCFNGEVRCLQVCSNGESINYYDRDWNLMPFDRPEPNTGKVLLKPKNYERMVELAEKLSKKYRFIRTDFYEIDGKVYFGELTFYHGAGFRRFATEEYEHIMGNWIDLNKKA